MPKADTELVVIDKMHALVVWSLNHIAKFPRSHRYGVGLRLEERVCSLMDLLLRAKFSRERLDLLREANQQLELLRFQFRVVKDLKCLSLESFGSASRFVNEIGKLIGGWMRQASRGNDAKNQPSVGRTGELSQPAARAAKGGLR